MAGGPIRQRGVQCRIARCGKDRRQLLLPALLLWNIFQHGFQRGDIAANLLQQAPVIVQARGIAGGVIVARRLFRVDVVFPDLVREV